MMPKPQGLGSIPDGVTRNFDANQSSSLSRLDSAGEGSRAFCDGALQRFSVSQRDRLHLMEQAETLIGLGHVALREMRVRSLAFVLLLATVAACDGGASDATGASCRALASTCGPAPGG